jgi:hypothetical protein
MWGQPPPAVRSSAASARQPLQSHLLPEEDLAPLRHLPQILGHAVEHPINELH